MLWLVLCCGGKDSADPDCTRTMAATDRDGDGYNACDDCDDTNSAVFPGAVEICGNSIDDDCDNRVDSYDAVDSDSDGFSGCDDCDELDPAVHIGALEVCNGIDDDCDGTVDVDPVDEVMYWPDSDGDARGDNFAEAVPGTCVAPEGLVDNAHDCDDTVYDPDALPCIRPRVIETEAAWSREIALVDLDADPALEIVFTEAYASTQPTAVWALDGDGTVLWTSTGDPAVFMGALVGWDDSVAVGSTVGIEDGVVLLDSQGERVALLDDDYGDGAGRSLAIVGEVLAVGAPSGDTTYLCAPGSRDSLALCTARISSSTHSEFGESLADIDADGDGQRDLFVGTDDAVFYGFGDATALDGAVSSDDHRWRVAGMGPSMAGDLDGDGIDDLVVHDLDNSIEVLSLPSDGSQPDSSDIWARIDGAAAVLVGGLDGDTQADLLAASTTDTYAVPGPLDSGTYEVTDLATARVDQSWVRSPAAVLGPVLSAETNDWVLATRGDQILIITDDDLPVW